MGACQCRGTERQFGPQVAERDLRRYRRRGPGKTTRILLESLEGKARSASLLDIGGGVGVIVHELLERQVARVTLVEAAEAYIAAAQAEARRRGHDDLLECVHGDFVNLAANLPEADIVTLDRAICCYPDVEALVSLSAARCRRWYGLSVPRDRWYVKVVVAIQNGVRWLQGNSFRTYVHPIGQIDELVRSAGLREHSWRRGLVWQVGLYGRDSFENRAVDRSLALQ